MTTIDTGEGVTVGGVGHLFGDRYLAEELVGRGGMASVYRAVDQSLGRTVALKVFRRDLADADDVRRQGEEIQLLASLNHPGLVTLYDAVADEDGRAFLVLEFVPGRELRLLLQEGPLDPAAVAVIGADVADALAYTHGRGIVHRDVKPGNILIPDGGATSTGPRAKLADFGIARIVDGTRLTSTGSVLGTASYLSPEQAVGGAIGPASDVYSFGLVLLESLTGARAFEGSGLEAAAARLARDPHVPDHLGAWAPLLREMTTREASRRPSAAQVAQRLRAIAGHPAELLDPTLRLPTAPDAATEAMAPPAAPAPPAPAPDHSPTQQLPPQAPATDPLVPAAPRRPAGARRRWPWVLGIVLALLIAAAVVLPLVLPGLLAGSADPAPAPDYPVLEGTLGEHLERLQESVAP